ncbi:MAG: toprim domain-containing protein, partial [Holosporales bacterium]|nr:toprim domain-containing protein [Holosporales bacterium]
EENFKNKFNNRIIFPIFNTNNKVIAFGGRLIKISQNAPKYLNSPETPIFHKGSNLFNLNFARTFTKKTSLIVVEGYMDVVMMVQNGFPQTVASLGTALTEDQISTAWRYSVHPILCFDGDAAGIMASRRAALRTLPILDSGKTLFFCYLPGELDPDEFLQEQGKDAMKGQLEKAVPLSDVIWNSLLTKYQKTANSSLLPEDQAALKKEIFDVTRLIKNPEIKKGYDSLLLGKFFSFLRKDRFFSKNPLKTSFYLKNLKFKQKSTLPQKILLGILLKVPILLLELDEFLLRIDFSDREFREIKDWLLSMHFSQADFEDDQTKRQLEVFLEKIGMNMLKTHASFLFDENVTTNDIIARWRDIWLQSIESGAVKEDLTYMSGLLKKNLNKDLWGKLKLLSNNKSNKDL